MLLLSNTITAANIDELQNISRNILLRSHKAHGQMSTLQTKKIEQLLKLVYDTVSKALKKAETNDTIAVKHEILYSLNLAELVLNIVEHSYHYKNGEMTDVIHKKLQMLRQKLPVE